MGFYSHRRRKLIILCVFKLSPLRLTLGQGLEKRRKAAVFSSCRNNLIKIQKIVGLEKTLSLYMSRGQEDQTQYQNSKIFLTEIVLSRSAVEMQRCPAFYQLRTPILFSPWVPGFEEFCIYHIIYINPLYFN